MQTAGLISFKKKSVSFLRRSVDFLLGILDFGDVEALAGNKRQKEDKSQDKNNEA